MSAFLCSDMHTAVLAIQIARLTKTRKSHKTILSGLRSLNNAALAYRYGDKPVRIANIDAAFKDAYAWINEQPETGFAARINSLAHCFEYQCSEGDVLETHKFAKFFNDAAVAIETVANKKTIDGVWSI